MLCKVHKVNKFYRKLDSNLLNPVIASSFVNSLLNFFYQVVVKTRQNLHVGLGSVRLKLLEQSIQIDELTRSIKQLTEQRNQCRQLRRKEGRFLQSVITQCKGGGSHQYLFFLIFFQFLLEMKQQISSAHLES